MKISDLFNVTGYGAIVTGGASGIGLGLTEALASNGARVTMLDVHAQRIETETKRLRDAGLDVRGQILDVTDHEALDAAFDAAVRARDSSAPGWGHNGLGFPKARWKTTRTNAGTA
jgi:NAD(P)-dependent dehydrogenase (short-subunit alcohol dehydrogenase family)